MIWQACNGEQQITSIQGELFRLVESQEQIATLGYVDTLEEQAILEELLEQRKPPYPEDIPEYHYLLKTPFRYPPLDWGSRFGRKHEQGIFYAGKSVAVTLVESAFYRLIFWSSMNAEPVKDKIRTEHSLFSVHYKTNQGLQLQTDPFNVYKDQLTDVTSYSTCQHLGTAMRDAGVEAFEYQSARDPERGICAGMFVPGALVEKKPQGVTRWLCETGATEVAFKQLSSSDVSVYPVELFMPNGVLPLPA